MSNALDQSLDGCHPLASLRCRRTRYADFADIISSKPRNRGIRKGRRGGALRVNKVAAAAARRPAGNGAGAAAGQQLNQNAQQSATAIFDQGSKIIVSNLVRPHPGPLHCFLLNPSPGLYTLGLCVVALLLVFVLSHSCFRN